MSKVLKEFKSSTGGTVQIFSWGLRHTAGRLYSGEANSEDLRSELEPKRGPGRPKKKG